YHTCLAYQVLAWRAEQLVLTDRRLIRTTGVITTTIDAVHLATITDTTYHQSLPGHLLGYGSLRIETPGQTQALQHLHHLPDPGAVYQALQR
ncbi:MAG: PH domain-containing protein, partial [Thermoleophilaceae bacterium]